MSKNSFQWLETLVACDTTSSKSNLDLVNVVHDWMVKQGLKTTIVFNKTQDKANIFATLPAKNGCMEGGIIFSGHTDVVPVTGQNWETSPFVTTKIENKIFGRGTSDMKSFLAVVLALIPKFKALSLNFPLHFAFSYDEEVGCRGIDSLIDTILQLKINPNLCIVGEPTQMNIITGHKGIQTFRCSFAGLAAHSSLTPYGCNTVEYAAKFVCFLRELADKLRMSKQNPHFDVPFSTISSNIIHGGIAHNVIPATCEVVFEFRNLPDVEPLTISAEIESYLVKLEEEMQREYPKAVITLESVSSSPSFSSSLDIINSPLAQVLNVNQKPQMVAYATEAGYFEQVGIKTIICGPGSIQQAHQANEFVAVDEIAKCEDFLLQMLNSYKC